MAIAIIIPARYASTRFPGKPLALLNGRPMIDHVHDKALAAVDNNPDVRVVIATDDDRIKNHCERAGMKVVMTPEDCATGSDRVIEAADRLGMMADDVVINLQGDAPMMPLEAISAVLNEFWTQPGTKVATPVKRLKWTELDNLRDAKRSTPFSGTTVVMNTQNRALWFSKNIIPGIRKEATMREESIYSPVFQHLGLYGYQISALERFTNLKEATYEKLEGLEQLRFLENGIPIQCIEISADIPILGGIDSPEDLERAQKLFGAAA